MDQTHALAESQAALEQAQKRIADLEARSAAEAQIHEKHPIGRSPCSIVPTGAEVALTGMQPAVARALVELGVDMSTFVTKADLQGGIAWARKNGNR